MHTKQWNATAASERNLKKSAFRVDPFQEDIAKVWVRERVSERASEREREREREKGEREKRERVERTHSIERTHSVEKRERRERVVMSNPADPWQDAIAQVTCSPAPFPHTTRTCAHLSQSCTHIYIRV
jgi:hypothetical protein